MGTWGPGVFENDHAQDLCSGEEVRLVKEVEAVLALEPVAFDDIEGPLLYVHLLSRLREECNLTRIDRGVVEKWKEKYLQIFDSTTGPGSGDYVARRREVIVREFDSLAARLPEARVIPPPTPKKRTKEAPKKSSPAKESTPANKSTKRKK